MNITLPLIAATSILLSAGAVADDAKAADDASRVKVEGPHVVTSAGAVEELDQSVSVEIEGFNIVNSRGEAIGDVDRVVRTPAGIMAVIGLSGSLKEVAVPLSELRLNVNRLVINSTKAELEEKTDIDITDFKDLDPGQYNRADFAHHSPLDLDIADNAVSASGAVNDAANESAVTADTAEPVAIEGVNVVNNAGEVLGDIDKVVQSSIGTMAVIGLSDSLKEVAVPLHELSWENDRLVIDRSKSELEEQTAIDMTDFEELEPGEYNRNEFARFERTDPKQ